MTRHTLTFAISISTLFACKGSESQPEPEKAGEVAAAPAPEPTKAPEPAPLPASPPKDAKTEAKPPEPTPAEPEIVAPPPEPAPEVVTLDLVVDADPLLQLLGAGVPEAVEVIAVHEHGRERIALYRLDVAAQWTARHPDADDLLEPVDAVVEECTTGYGEIPVGCIEKSADKYPGVPPEVAGYYGSESRAFEVAHVKLDSDTKGSVLARRRLFDHAWACEGECFETKLKVYDMDGDSRSEILIVFPIQVPSEHNFGSNQNPAALAFVLDKADFHVQFATTRKYYDYGGDLSTHESDFETTFVARDTDADGHADLVLREVGSESRSEEGEDREVTKTDESVTCVWERAGDRWVCPKTLGKQLVDGGQLVQVTRIPLPPAEPAPTPP